MTVAARRSSYLASRSHRRVVPRTLFEHSCGASTCARARVRVRVCGCASERGRRCGVRRARLDHSRVHYRGAVAAAVHPLPTIDRCRLQVACAPVAFDCRWSLAVDSGVDIGRTRFHVYPRDVLAVDGCRSGGL